LRLLPTEIENCTVNWAGGDAAEWSRERMRDLSAPFGTAFERDGDALVTAIGEGDE
jgi:poly-gamma-glutamate synthesis protein (capsule biosynthesis protein)